MQQLLTEPLSFQGKVITLYTLIDLFSVKHFWKKGGECGFDQLGFVSVCMC